MSEGASRPGPPLAVLVPLGISLIAVVAGSIILYIQKRNDDEGYDDEEEEERERQFLLQSQLLSHRAKVGDPSSREVSVRLDTIASHARASSNVGMPAATLNSLWRDQRLQGYDFRLKHPQDGNLMTRWVSVDLVEKRAILLLDLTRTKPNDPEDLQNDAEGNSGNTHDTSLDNISDYDERTVQIIPLARVKTVEATTRIRKVKLVYEDESSFEERTMELEFATRNSMKTFTDLIKSYVHGKNRMSHLRVYVVTFNVGDADPLYQNLTSARPSGSGANTPVERMPRANRSSHRRAKSVSNAEPLPFLEMEGQSLAESVYVDPTDEERIDALLPSDLDTYDIIAIALQECSKKSQWEKTISSLFNLTDFSKVKSVFSWDRALFIYAKDSVKKFISNVRVLESWVGVGGFAGNKGAVAVRFFVYDTDILILNSHLAAHQDELARRNWDYANIYKKIMELQYTSGNVMTNVNSPVHYTFWVGDLNYRIETDVASCMSMIEQKDWSALLAKDQLRKVQATNEAFSDFHESEINFPPTYKMKRLEDEYNAERNRVPSYCDRILYHHVEGGKIKSLKYDTLFNVKGSDHRPVYGGFQLKLLHTSGLHFRIRDDVNPTLGLFFQLYDTPKRYQLSFLSLECSGLFAASSDGHSDPYCVFTSDAFRQALAVSTSVKSGTLNPEWTQDELPTIELYDGYMRSIRMRYIVVRVYDKELGTNDILGRAVIWLGSGIGSSIGSNAGGFRRSMGGGRSNSFGSHLSTAPTLETPSVVSLPSSSSFSSGDGILFESSIIRRGVYHGLLRGRYRIQAAPTVAAARTDPSSTMPNVAATAASTASFSTSPQSAQEKNPFVTPTSNIVKPQKRPSSIMIDTASSAQLTYDPFLTPSCQVIPSPEFNPLFDSFETPETRNKVDAGYGGRNIADPVSLSLSDNAMDINISDRETSAVTAYNYESDPMSRNVADLEPSEGVEAMTAVGATEPAESATQSKAAASQSNVRSSEPRPSSITFDTSVKAHGSTKPSLQRKKPKPLS